MTEEEEKLIRKKIRKKVEKKYGNKPRLRVPREGRIWPRKKTEVTIEELEEIFETLER